MKYAVIKFAGSQYLVAEGDQIIVNRLTQKESDEVEMKEVLLLVDDQKVTLGKPMVKGAVVTAKVVNHFLGKKLRIAKFKAKTGYRRVTGYRPQLTSLKIEKVTE